MKNEEDEAFDELAKRQGDWGGGYQAKRKMAADKLQEPEREALNLALEALTNAIAVRNGEGGTKLVSPLEENAITAIKEALAQPVQEPVALVIDGVLVKSALPKKYTGHLYTAPPQREWVGLTPEETSGFTQHEMTVVKYVSKVLQEKNNG